MPFEGSYLGYFEDFDDLYFRCCCFERILVWDFDFVRKVGWVAVGMQCRMINYYHIVDYYDLERGHLADSMLDCRQA